MFFGFSYLQWFFAILYLILAYRTYTLYLKKNKKMKKSYVSDANDSYLANILLFLPNLFFFYKTQEFNNVSSKVAVLYLSFAALILYYINLLLYYYIEKRKKKDS